MNIPALHIKAGSGETTGYTTARNEGESKFPSWFYHLSTDLISIEDNAEVHKWKTPNYAMLRVPIFRALRTAELLPIRFMRRFDCLGSNY